MCSMTLFRSYCIISQSVMFHCILLHCFLLFSHYKLNESSAQWHLSFTQLQICWDCAENDSFTPPPCLLYLLCLSSLLHLLCRSRLFLPASLVAIATLSAASSTWEVITFKIAYLTKMKSCCTRIFFFWTQCKDLLSCTERPTFSSAFTFPLPCYHSYCRLSKDSSIALHFLHLIFSTLSKKWDVLAGIAFSFSRYFTKGQHPHKGYMICFDTRIYVELCFTVCQKQFQICLAQERNILRV